MKTSRKLLTLILAVLMLVSVLPLNAFAASYAVYLHCGPEGWGSTAWPLTKTSGTALPLLHTKQEIFRTYGMLPGKQVTNDQRTFIEWNTAYNATTGRGTGTAYYDYYTADAGTTLYAIWGYNIQFNADGGTFPNPTSGKDIYLTYVAGYNLQDQTDPKTDYSYCMPDVFGNTPTKAGCRRVQNGDKPSYALLNADLSFFCWETPDQNLTIPPTGGYMEWSVFHCADTAKEGNAPEFLAIWEPSVTYNANGGSGSMSTDYLSWTGDALWDYESYKAKSNKFTKSGATFTGWNTEADGTGTAIAVGTQLGGQKTNSDPITLYAQWSDGSSVNPTPTPTPTPDPEPDTSKDWTITFDPNGGTMVGSTTYGINTGDVYSDVIGSMPTATRSGYTLSGWYNEKYGYTLNMSDYFAVSEDVTFKAQWTRNTTDEDTYATGVYEVTANSLSMRSGPGSSYSRVAYLSKGTQVTITQTSGKWGYCTYNGNTGWISLAYCDYIGESSGDDTTSTYTLTFDTNGGTMPSGYSTTYGFEADEKFIDVIGGYPVPTRSGYTFEGWRRTDYTPDFWVGGWGTQPYTFGHDVTLKAEWTANAHTHSYTSSVTKAATCTTAGVRTYTCSCGDSYTESIRATGHTYNNGDVTTAPTCENAGIKTFTCIACDDSYTEAISATGHSFGDYSYNNDATCVADGTKTRKCSACDAVETVTAQGTATGEHLYYDYISNNDASCTLNGTMTAYCEYGCGTTDTITDMGSALDHIYTAATTEATCTEDGAVVYTCDRCGDSYRETIPATGHAWGEWVETVAPTTTTLGEETRTCSVCSATETQDVPMLDPEPVEGEPYLTAEGVQLTIHNLYGVKDVWVAEGDYDTYRDVKNHALFNVTAAKIGTATDYTYMVKNHGRHTVYIRYTDGSAAALKIDITGVEPTFRTNGLQLTIGNLENVKVIRTAYGEYTAVRDIKRAATHRAFTAKNEIKGADTYKIQYRDNGVVTVAVVYNDGYEEFFTYEVQKKVPTLIQNNNTVTFGNLDGLYVIRYAKGTYTTSSQIKAAAGSKAVKSTAINENGNIVIAGLAVGTYTFCVQYDDESFNYYTIVVE